MSMQEGVGLKPTQETEQAQPPALVHPPIPDMPAQTALDDLAWLASRLCSTPAALVCLVDEHSQGFSAHQGPGAEESARAIEVCLTVFKQDGLVEVEDVLQDARLANNPLFISAPPIRFYASVPLVDSTGQRLGALCVADTCARRLDASQREALQRLARRAADSLETRRQRSRAESRERTLALLLEAMPDAVVTCDAAGLLAEFNKVAREWHGVDPRALPPEEWAQHFNLYQPDGRELLATERIPLLRAWRGERVREAALVIKAQGQPQRTVLCNADPLRSADGALLGAVCVMHDITDRLAAEERLRTVADNVPALIARVDADLRYQFVNQPFARWFGMQPEGMVGQHMGETLRPKHYASLLPRVKQALAGQTVIFDMDVVDRDGQLRHMHITYVPDAPLAGNADGPAQGTGFHLMVYDLTEKTQTARMLHKRALTDELTGLPNRAAWNSELQRGVARADRADVPATVMFLDLDAFKQVNDSFGHAVGDRLLCEFAHRLRGCLRRSDFIARLGGDEFVVLLDRVMHPDVDPVAVAGKVMVAMQPGVCVDGQPFQIKPSIGVAVQRGPARDAARLMQTADEAMYQAKRSADVQFVVLEC